MKKEVIAHKDPKSPVSEVFRTLRTNIQFMNTNKKLSTLLVTSTFPGEGKSWAVSNLAVTFAQAGKRVILIDADMRKGRQYAIFGISPRPGLSNFLSQVEIDETDNISENIADYIQETEVDNLYIISAGNVPPNPSELLVSSKMIKLLNELKQLCDIVIIDGTPCELVTDSIILSRIVDSTVIVTAHKMTKKDALERVVKNIQNVGGNIAGVVINKVPISSKVYGEKYYYYVEDKIFNGKDKKNKKAKQSKKNSYKTEEINKERILKTIEIDKKEKIDNMQQSNISEEKVEATQTSQQEPKENTSNTIGMEKTNEILKQINDYLEKEKKDLK